MICKLIVGLGNPGERYARTRHNFGAQVVAAFGEKIGADRLRERGVAFQLPSVDMNNGGTQVVEFLRNSPLKPSDILLIHDELELPLGELAFQTGGSAHGHNGVRSVHEALQTMDIPRLRLGISRPLSAQEVSAYVLQQFETSEEEVVARVVEQAIDWLTRYCALTES